MIHASSGMFCESILKILTCWWGHTERNTMTKSKIKLFKEAPSMTMVRSIDNIEQVLLERRISRFVFSQDKVWWS